MSDEPALLKAIVANPDEDTPRLAYADWLDEHDRPIEAEFLRLGCVLETETPDQPEFIDHLGRLAELQYWLAAHLPRPAPKFSAGVSVDGGAAWWQSNRRGFPRYIDFERGNRSGARAIRAMTAALEKAFSELPTRWLAVRFITVDQLAEFLRQPVVEQLDTLTLQLETASAPHDEAARLIADCPRLRNLRGLLPAFEIGTAGAIALAGSEYLGSLEWLDWSFSGVPAEGMRVLAAAPWFRNLRNIGFDYGLPAEAFQELCRAEPLPRLHTLNLADNEFTPAAWEAFARSRAFPALARLEVGSTGLVGAHEAVFQAAWFRPAYLDLGGCDIGNGGAAALAESPWAESLRLLRLWGNRIRAKGAVAIGRSRKFARLKSLDLSDNALGAEGLRSLARNPALRGLTSLTLDNPGRRSGQFSPKHFHDFLTRLDMPGLRHLSLRDCPVGPKAARLLTSEKFGSLTRLDLSGCGLTDAATRALLTSPTLQNLIELDLGENGLCDGLKPLTNRGTLPQLSAGRLNGNRIDTALAKRLRRRPGVSC